jgi:CheY-like chemotaxis protein
VSLARQDVWVTRSATRSRSGRSRASCGRIWTSSRPASRTGLATRFEIEPGTLDARLPTMMLEPLVESAIRHGIAQDPSARLVEIRASRPDGPGPVHQPRAAQPPPWRGGAARPGVQPARWYGRGARAIMANGTGIRMTTPLRVLIADDEPAARRTIQLLLAGDPDFQVLGECADGAQTVEAILQLQPDLVFLDVQMPRRNGFDVLARIPASAMPLIILVTAFDEYSLGAFDVHAADICSSRSATHASTAPAALRGCVCTISSGSRPAVTTCECIRPAAATWYATPSAGSSATCPRSASCEYTDRRS